MAEGKKTDDYTIQMDSIDQGNKSFEAPPPPQPRSPPSGSLSNNPILPVLAYCGSSILMTVMNKYVLSGTDFNLNFFLLCIQVCWLISEHMAGVYCMLKADRCSISPAVSRLYHCNPDL